MKAIYLVGIAVALVASGAAASSTFRFDDDAVDAAATVSVASSPEVPEPLQATARPSAEILGAEVRPGGASFDVAIVLADARVEPHGIDQSYAFRFVAMGVHWIVEWRVVPTGTVTTTLCVEGGYDCRVVPGLLVPGESGEVSATVTRDLVPSAGASIGLLGLKTESRVDVRETCAGEPCPVDVRVVTRDSASTLRGATV